MALTVEISVPPEALTLSGHDSTVDAAVEFETLVSFGESARVLFRVDDAAAVDARGDGDGEGRPVRLRSKGDRALYEAEVASGADPIVESLDAGGVYVVSGSGDAQGWRFRLLCVDRQALAEFTERLTDRGVPVTLDRIHREDDRVDSLSTKQRTAVRSALDGGYFDVPRRTTVAELAAAEGISDSAFSQRLRRGLGVVLRESLAGGILRKGDR